MMKHGMHKTAEYNAWSDMIQRCTNPNVKCYPDYGGRGITVCERWFQFENFLADMGVKPSASHSLDRKDNDGNYELSNCRWATVHEQFYNRSCSIVVDVGGVRKTITDWAIENGLSYPVIIKRIQRGWSRESAVMTPLMRIRK
jgi:hypothetical protein